MPTLGKFIQRRRMELGLTQEQLAERIGSGVRQSEISRLEHDRISLPRRQRLEQIALALDVSLGQLLARSGWAEAEQEFAESRATVPSPAYDSPLNGEASFPSPVPSTAHDSSSNGESFPSPDDTTVPTADTLPLTDAIDRAEELIAYSGAIVEQSQAAYDQARRAVRYSRRRQPLSQ
jgi:transcriptional regulator with XRE-family HTH domain